MADVWKFLEEPPATSLSRHRMRSYWPALASLAVIVLVVWASLIPFQQFSGLFSWKMLVAPCIAAALVTAILWKVPQWQVGKLNGLAPQERFDRVNEARKTLAVIAALMAVLAGFYVTVQNLKAAQRSFALAQEGQMTERFSKAIEQMGAMDASGRKNLEVRMGGVYALERIANESEKDHWPAMEVLAAYVRGNAERPQLPARSARSSAVWDAKPATDVQTVLAVLGRRNLQWEYTRPVLDLENIDIKGANLFQANLIRADLSAADLSGANLIEASLIRTNLREADLSGANLNWAQLTGADLRGSRLSNAKLGGANLTDARLSSANLTQAKLDGADLHRADLSGADLRETDLSDADLRGADLRGAKNLTQQQIDEANGDSTTKLPNSRRMPNAWKDGQKQ